MAELEKAGPSTSPFDVVRRVDESGAECWSARDLMGPLGYQRWERFQDALERAQASCKANGHNASDHFRGAAKMIDLPKGAAREVEDFRLSRYACYLVAMNGDPRKPEIAAAQHYFAVKTREAEVAATQSIPANRGGPIVQQIEMLLAVARKQEEQDRKQQEHDIRIKAVEADAASANTIAHAALDQANQIGDALSQNATAFTLVHWCRMRGIRLIDGEDKAEGTRCKNLNLKGRNLPLAKVHLQRMSPNVYPVACLLDWEQDFRHRKPERFIGVSVELPIQLRQQLRLTADVQVRVELAPPAQHN